MLPVGKVRLSLHSAQCMALCRQDRASCFPRRLKAAFNQISHSPDRPQTRRWQPRQALLYRGSIPWCSTLSTSLVQGLKDSPVGHDLCVMLEEMDRQCLCRRDWFLPQLFWRNAQGQVRDHCLQAVCWGAALGHAQSEGSYQPC